MIEIDKKIIIFCVSSSFKIHMSEDPFVFQVAYWSQTVYLRGMPKEFLSKWQSAGTYAHPHRRETVLLRSLRPQIHYIVPV